MEVCARCHGMSSASHFRNLAEPGGPGFPEAAIKSLAATYKVDDAPNEQGKINKRPACSTDALPSPYKNEQEARYAQNGALPPDLSLIAKARGVEADTPFYRVPDTMLRDIASGYQEGGADYVYAYLTGYAEPPAGMKMADFMNYNKVFPGHQTAMPNPFLGGDGLVKYDDGTPATVDNYARDVMAFLAWAADPTLEERKRMGLLVMLYLLITAVLFGLAKRRIWRERALRAIADYRAGTGTPILSPPRAGRGVGRVRQFVDFSGAGEGNSNPRRELREALLCH